MDKQTERFLNFVIMGSAAVAAFGYGLISAMLKSTAAPKKPTPRVVVIGVDPHELVKYIALRTSTERSSDDEPAAASDSVTCGICGAVLTNDNATLRPELFLCDACIKRGNLMPR